MTNISVADAKNRLSELITRAMAGEEIAVTRHGKPVARLVAAKAGDARTQRAKVVEAFRCLGQIRSQVRLDGDLKAIAREGLD